jgi:uncharacterized protein (TIGR03546 family)
MLILRFLQKLIKTLNSDGTPGQVAAGLALGAAFGLTPIANLHNLLILVAVTLVNVSFPAALLGLVMFAPVGFLLDPIFDSIGNALLANGPLLPAWTTFYNAPVIPLSNYNNTVVLGSLVGWAVLSLPIFFLGRFGVGKYRKKLLPKLEKMKFVRAVKASKFYNMVGWFRVPS